MQKTFLIMRREYRARVYSQAFVVLCLLLPVLLVAMLMSTFVNTRPTEKKKDESILIFQIIDKAHFLPALPPAIGNIEFVLASTDADAALKALQNDKIAGVLNIQGDRAKPKIKLLSKGPLDERDVRAISLSIQHGAYTTSDPDFELEMVDISNTIPDQPNIRTKTVLGILLSCVIYFFIFFYGVRTLNAVIEEKMNRVSEIIISSVTPFELMMGKILGTTLAVLTQVIIVAGLTFMLTKVAVAWTGPDPASVASVQVGQETQTTTLLESFSAAAWIKIAFGFVVFFVFGFMLYAAIFAAIGAAMEPNADTLQFVFPVLIPLVFSLILAITSALSDPTNTAMVWTSFVPFFSPVVMMMRIVHGAAWWEVILSMLLLLGTFVAITFLAGRVFRVGILLYGTKPSLKLIGKWLFTA
ncbi:MAG: ABC transporter permease [Bacteroidota bacterium]